MQNILGDDLIHNMAQRGGLLAYTHRVTKRASYGDSSQGTPTIFVVECIYGTYDHKLVKGVAFDAVVTGGALHPSQLVRTRPLRFGPIVNIVNVHKLDAIQYIWLDFQCINVLIYLSNAL